MFGGAELLMCFCSFLHSTIHGLVTVGPKLLWFRSVDPIMIIIVMIMIIIMIFFIIINVIIIQPLAGLC